MATLSKPRDVARVFYTRREPSGGFAAAQTPKQPFMTGSALFKPDIRLSGREPVHYAHWRIRLNDAREVAGAELRDRIIARKRAYSHRPKGLPHSHQDDLTTPA
jgi:hypothetical protein